MTKQTDKPYCFCEVTKDTCENCFTVIDIETTGFGDRAGIVELAAVKFKDGKVVDTFNSLINPQIPIPPSATINPSTPISSKYAASFFTNSYSSSLA